MNLAQKILVVGPSWVGDMLMTHSLFRMLKQENPEVIIDVIAPAWSLGLLERMPEVRKSIVLPFKHGEIKLWQRYCFGKQFRAERYDQVIFIPNSLKSLFVVMAAKIPKWTGWNGKELPRRWFLNDGRTLEKKHYPLMVQRFAALALPKDRAFPAVFPLPQLQINAAVVGQTLIKYQLQRTNQPLLVLAPGSEFGPSKRWPAKYFAEIANTKIIAGWKVWLLGSAKDEMISAEVQSLTNNRCIDLTGKTSLTEVVDLLSLATMVVSNDSGLMHMAAALQRPVVGIYGSTPADVTPPLSKQSAALSLGLSCSPCYQRECPEGHWRCMLDLKPERILQSMEHLLANESTDS